MKNLNFPSDEIEELYRNNFDLYGNGESQGNDDDDDFDDEDDE